MLDHAPNVGCSQPGTTVMQNGFTESGAGSLNLAVAPQTTNSLRSILGAELTARFPARNPAFDVTPAALIAAIVTERGIHRAPFLDLSPAAPRQGGSPAGALS